MIEIKILSTILLSSIFACSQSKKVFDVNEPSYKGMIVKNDVNIFVDNKKTWFEPTIMEVKKAEQLLAAQIEELNKEKLNQNREDCPVIDKNLGKYIRQYIGFINTSGEKIILMNMLWAKGVDSEGLDSEYILVLDGCSHYWKIKVNLSNNILYDLEVNGSA